jgi:pyruvate carboxylase
MDIETVALYTENDISHTLHASQVIQLSSPGSYLNINELVKIAQDLQVDAVHPGYGFLSEDSEFARRMFEEAEVVVIGPGWEILERTADKTVARQLATQCDVPVLPALPQPTDDVADIEQFVKKFGLPIVIKAVDGGGGRGIRMVHNSGDLTGLMNRALAESPSGLVYAEKAALGDFRHIEVQIVGDGKGNVRHLWERECSIQRRFQKIIEFAPSSIRDRKLVANVIKAAVRLAEKVGISFLFVHLGFCSHL